MIGSSEYVAKRGEWPVVAQPDVSSRGANGRESPKRPASVCSPD
jgi:hypothetical protein